MLSHGFAFLRMRSDICLRVNASRTKCVMIRRSLHIVFLKTIGHKQTLCICTCVSTYVDCLILSSRCLYLSSNVCQSTFEVEDTITIVCAQVCSSCVTEHMTLRCDTHLQYHLPVTKQSKTEHMYNNLWSYFW